MKEIYRENLFIMYEDTNNYYLKFIPGKKIEFGKHTLPAELFKKLPLNYFVYVYAARVPGGGWEYSSACIDKDYIMLPRLDIEVYSLSQIIFFKKNTIIQN